MVLPRTSPCDNHECLNGAQCVVTGSDPRCQCLHGYEGEHCETLVSVNFMNRASYLQLPSNLLSPETNISLQVEPPDRIKVKPREMLSGVGSDQDDWMFPVSDCHR